MINICVDFCGPHNPDHKPDSFSFLLPSQRGREANGSMDTALSLRRPWRLRTAFVFVAHQASSCLYSSLILSYGRSGLYLQVYSMYCWKRQSFGRRPTRPRRTVWSRQASCTRMEMAKIIPQMREALRFGRESSYSLK